MTKACVFDLDGTLLDTSFALRKCMNESLKKLDLKKYNIDENKILSISLDLTKIYVGDGLEVYIERVLKYLNIYKEDIKDDILKIYTEVAREYNLYKVEPYMDIIFVLNNLKKKGIKLAILSNKVQEIVEKNCEKFFEKGLFDIIYGARQGINIKPDPSSLNSLIKELGVDKKEVLYFGDTNVDMKVSVNAGVDGVGVLWGFREKKELIDNGAKYILSKPMDILLLI